MMVVGNCMGPGLQLAEVRFSNFLLGKLSRDFKHHVMSTLHDIQMAIFRYFVTLQLNGWARGSTTGIVHGDMTLTRSKVKVKVTGILNFRQLAMQCMLAAMTAAHLRGFLVNICNG